MARALTRRGGILIIPNNFETYEIRALVAINGV